MKPNAEQQAIIDAFLGHDGSIAVNALAGTGKTTTLKMLAAAAPAQRMQYIAFNRAIADDAQAKMPSNVTVSTMHSLAYRAMQPDRKRLEMRLGGVFVAQKLGIKVALAQLEFGDFVLTPAQMGAAALATVSRYCNSADVDLLKKHVPSWRTVFDECPSSLDYDQEIKETVFKSAQRLWGQMRDRKSDWPITHDTYLKLWALAQGQIKTDVIFFDEAQDASGVFLQILENQRDRRIVFVGDQNQQIYAWRGAVDALQRISADERLYLTRSYRFGQGIADQANRMLQCLGETHLLIGEGSGRGVDGSEAILCRTNAKAITIFCEHDQAQLVGAREFLGTVRSLSNLIDGRGSTGAFALFPTFTALCDYAATPDGSDLRPLLDLVGRRGVDDVISRLERASESRSSTGPVISTVHKAKGREWDTVKIEDDWRIPKKELRQDEMRLMYVALTRGRCVVDAGEVLTFVEACESLAFGDGGTEPAGEPAGEGDLVLARAVIQQAKARAAVETAAATNAAPETKKPRKSRRRGVA